MDLCNATSGTGIPVFAVVKEAGSPDAIDGKDPVLADYASKYFTCGQVYLDPDWGFYSALGSRTIGLSGLYDYIWNPLKAWGRIRALRDKQIDGTLNGEGKTLGGVIVMAPGDAGVAYTYLEETGKELPAEEIREAISRVVAMGETDTSSGECQQT